jgi:membrane protein DedA with SNARE-associated domain
MNFPSSADFDNCFGLFKISFHQYSTEKRGDMIQSITAMIMNLMQTHGSVTVFVGVIIESIIVPIPSPLIIMGAGAILIEPNLSYTNVFLPILLKIVLPGAVASTIGSFFAFGLAYWGGKPLIERFRNFLGFDWDDVVRMEKVLLGRINLMIFLLRALPIVPLSLISGVAGVLRFPIRNFAVWTFLGSLPRCLILGYLGYLTRGTYEGLAKKMNSVESLLSAGIVAVVFALIFWLRWKMAKLTKPTSE